MFASLLRSAALAVVTLSASAQAADVFVVHGIDGTDLGLDQSLLVDIELNDGPLLEDVPFQAFADFADLAPGSYDVRVRLSDGITDSYTGTTVLDTSFNLAAFETAAVVAHLDQNGTISLSKFTISNRDIAAGNARITVAHAAEAPKVDILARATGASARIRQLANGEQTGALDIPAGDVDFKIKPSFSKATVAQLDDVAIAGNILLVAAGSVANGTFTVIPVVIG